MCRDISGSAGETRLVPIASQNPLLLSLTRPHLLMPLNQCKLDAPVCPKQRGIAVEGRNYVFTVANLAISGFPVLSSREKMGATFSPTFPDTRVYLLLTITCQDLVDSGAAGNFIDSHLAHALKIPLVALGSPLSVSALDCQPLCNGKVTSATSPLRMHVDDHLEEVSLHLIDSPEFPMVLGFPWLRRHNTHIDSATGSILEWGPTCHATCLFSSPFRESKSPDSAVVQCSHRVSRLERSFQQTKGMYPSTP